MHGRRSWQTIVGRWAAAIAAALCLAPPAAVAAGPVWDLPVLIDPAAGPSQRPVFDAQGNAYALLFTATTLHVARLSGGVWSSLGTVATSSGLQLGGYLAADAAGRLSVIYRDGPSLLARHMNSAGWGPASLLFTGPQSLLSFAIRADASGNAVATWLLQEPVAGGGDTVVGAVFDISTGTWSPAQVLAQHARIDSVTLESDATGQHLMLLYLKDDGDVGGNDKALVSHRYQLATRQWEPATQLPRTRLASASCDDSALNTQHLPLAIDTQGRATALATFCSGVLLGRQRRLHGLRFEDGRWLAPVALSTDAQFHAMASAGFGTMDDQGVYLATQTQLDASGTAVVVAVRHTPGSGFAVEPVGQDYVGGGPPQLAWLGNDGAAVVLQSTPALATSVGVAGSWSLGPVPLDSAAGGASSRRAPDGSVLTLLRTPDGLGLRSAWLRWQ